MEIINAPVKRVSLLAFCNNSVVSAIEFRSTTGAKMVAQCATLVVHLTRSNFASDGSTDDDFSPAFGEDNPSFGALTITMLLLVAISLNRPAS